MGPTNQTPTQNTMITQNTDVAQKAMTTIIQIHSTTNADDVKDVQDFLADISSRFGGEPIADKAVKKPKNVVKLKPKADVEEDDEEEEDEEPAPVKKKSKKKKAKKPEHSIDDVKKAMADAIEAQTDEDSTKAEINAARKEVQKVFIDEAGVTKSAEIKEADFGKVIEGLEALTAEYE